MGPMGMMGAIYIFVLLKSIKVIFFTSWRNFFIQISSKIIFWRNQNKFQVTSIISNLFCDSFRSGKNLLTSKQRLFL